MLDIQKKISASFMLALATTLLINVKHTIYCEGYELEGYGLILLWYIKDSATSLYFIIDIYPLLVNIFILFAILAIIVYKVRFKLFHSNIFIISLLVFCLIILIFKYIILIYFSIFESLCI